MIHTRNPRINGLHLLNAYEVAEYLGITELEVLEYFMNLKTAPKGFPLPHPRFLEAGHVRWISTEVEEFRVANKIPDYTFTEEDIASVCPLLTIEQCFCVLDYIFKHYDTNQLISNELIMKVATDLYPEFLSLTKAKKKNKPTIKKNFCP